MINTLLERIQIAEIGKNKPATALELTKAHIALKTLNIPTIPSEMGEILLKYNGLSNEGALLLGLENDNQFFPNLVQYNKIIFRGKTADFLILGYDEFLYLIYDATDNMYKLADKDDFEAETVSQNLEAPLCTLLRID